MFFCVPLAEHLAKLASHPSNQPFTYRKADLGTPRERRRRVALRRLCRKNTFVMYIHQQDAKNSCDQTSFSIRCSTCFGLYQSIFRSNFISCTSHLVYADTCGYSHTTATRMVLAYTGIRQMRCTAYKVALEDGLIQSETRRASNGK